MTTATDDDLRDLLWRMGNSPGEIEAHMANPYTRVWLKLYADEISQLLAERAVRKITVKLFSHYMQSNVE